MQESVEDAAKITDQLFWLCPENVWFGRAKKNQQVQILLDQIASFDHPAALPVIVRFLLSKEPATRTLASNAIAEISSRLSTSDILHLGELISTRRSWHVSQEWGDIKSSQVSAYAMGATAEHRAFVLGLLSFHANGYVRHEAVCRLSSIHDGNELPYLLIRQNDWVQPIAVDATQAVTNRLNKSYLPHFEKQLGLVFRLDSWNRQNNTEVVDKTLALVFANSQTENLESIITSLDSKARRWFVIKGLEFADYHRSQLIDRALHSFDPMIRLTACRKLQDVCNVTEIPSCLSRLRSDPFMPVRREALLLSADAFPDQAHQLYQEGLLDQSRTIRELCRFHLKKHGHNNFASFYRDALAKSSDMLPALCGLAETADATDIERFENLLRHPLVSRRCAAVQGLGRSLDEKPFPDCMGLLNDTSPRVVREVQKSLKAQVASLPLAELYEVALNGKEDFNRKNAVLLIADRGKWSSLSWLLRIVTEADPETAAIALEEIQSHLLANKVFTKPTEQQKQQIVVTLDDARSRLNSKVVALIESDLKYFAT